MELEKLLVSFLSDKYVSQALQQNPGNSIETLKRNEEQLEWAGNLHCWGKFQWNFDQGKGNIVWVSVEFKWPKFELSRVYCTSDVTNNRKWTLKTVRLTSFQKPQCNLFQSHNSSLRSSHWSIQGSFCICCAIYTFFWHFEHGFFFHVSLSLVQFWLNTFVTHPVISFNQCRLILTSGRSRGGAHPPPLPPLIFRPNWGPKRRKMFVGDQAPPYLKVWIRHC